MTNNKTWLQMTPAERVAFRIAQNKRNTARAAEIVRVRDHTKNSRKSARGAEFIKAAEFMMFLDAFEATMNHMDDMAFTAGLQELAKIAYTL